MFEYLHALKSPSQKAFLSLVILVLCEQTIFIYPIVVLGHIGPLQNISKLILPIAYIILTVMSLNKKVIGEIPRMAILIPLFFFMAILVTVILYPQNEKYIVDNLDQIWLVLPFFLIGLCFKADKLTMDTLGKWCCLGVIMTAFYRLLYSDATFDEKSYNMDASYTALASILIVINYAFYSKKIIPILCSVLGLFYTISMGTRGPILIELIFLFLCLFIHLHLSKGVKYSLAAVTAVLIVAFLNSNVYIIFLTWLSDFLGGFGFSTRIIDIALEDQMLDYTSGRSEIYVDLWARLLERPLQGYGVYGEWTLGYASAHNMYLETLYHYGIPLGTLVLVVYIVTTIKAYKNAPNIYVISWLTIWVCYVYVRGFFGGSFLRFGVFLLWGFCVAVNYRHRNHIAESFS